MISPQAADMAADFKTASYVFLQTKGLIAEFMTCVELNTSYCNGFHYNFSLWDSKGQNVFANRDNPKEMSNFGRHWLAGLVKHCPALIAFCSPTINCYR